MSAHQRRLYAGSGLPLGIIPVSRQSTLRNACSWACFGTAAWTGKGFFFKFCLKCQKFLKNNTKFTVNFWHYKEEAPLMGRFRCLVDPSLGKGVDWDMAGSPKIPVRIGGIPRVGGSLGNRPVPPLSRNSQTPQIQKIKMDSDAPIL